MSYFVGIHQQYSLLMIKIFLNGYLMDIDGDLWIIYQFLYIPEKLAQYRIWQGQMSHKTIERMDNAQKIMKKFFEEHSGLFSKSEIRRAWGVSFTRRARCYLEQNCKKEALNNLIMALKYYPNNLITWKSILKLLIK